MNNKGFTLVELIATIAILALIVTISVPIVTSVINNSKEKNYTILVSNIKTAAKTYYEECDFNNSAAISSICTNHRVTLKQLANYGFLSTNRKENCTGDNCVIITNPKDNKDIATCIIEITKTVNASNYKTTYTIESKSTNTSCPTTNDYK